MNGLRGVRFPSHQLTLNIITMTADFSPQTTESVLDYYEARVKALASKIEFLEAQLDVLTSQNEYK